MSYDEREISVYDGEPYELYLFQTEAKSWRLTSADRAIEYLSETYEPTPIKRTATEQGQELKSGTVKIQIPKAHLLAGEFIRFIPSTPMSLVIYRGHEGDAEVVVVFTGGVTSAEFTDVCELSAIPESEILKASIPMTTYQKQCNHFLYDQGCGVDKEDFKIEATLTSVDGVTVQAAEFATQPDGWLNAGYIEKWTERRMILTHVGDTVTLLNEMAGLEASDAVNAFAGCMRDSDTCVAKFDNLLNFLGFEFIPSRNPFNGGVS